MMTTVTIRPMNEDDELYPIVEKTLLMEGNVKPDSLRRLLVGEKTRHATPRLWVIIVDGEAVGHVITFDFFQATYITTFFINKEMRCRGYGSMLLQHVCHDPNRTYVLLSEVARSDKENFSECLRRNIFYLRNGFRTVPIKWRTEENYKYDVHVKGPNLEVGSLLAALRKGSQLWLTADLDV